MGACSEREAGEFAHDTEIVRVPHVTIRAAVETADEAWRNEDAKCPARSKRRNRPVLIAFASDEDAIPDQKRY